MVSTAWNLDRCVEYSVTKPVTPATKPGGRWWWCGESRALQSTNRRDPALASTRWWLLSLSSAPHTLGFIQLRSSCEDLWMSWHHRTPCFPVKARGCVEWLRLSRDCGCADRMSTWAGWCCWCRKWPDGVWPGLGATVCVTVCCLWWAGAVCRRACKMDLSMVVVLYCVKSQ